jgi:hypothetical protein
MVIKIIEISLRSLFIKIFDKMLHKTKIKIWIEPKMGYN